MAGISASSALVVGTIRGLHDPGEGSAADAANAADTGERRIAVAAESKSTAAEIQSTAAAVPAVHRKNGSAADAANAADAGERRTAAVDSRIVVAAESKATAAHRKNSAVDSWHWRGSLRILVHSRRHEGKSKRLADWSDL